MTERDDFLIQAFFQEHRQEIADNGFSERVIRNLPKRNIIWWNRLWTLLCGIVAIILFWMLDGKAKILTEIRTILGDGIGIVYDALANSHSFELTTIYVVIALILLSANRLAQEI